MHCYISEIDFGGLYEKNIHILIESASETIAHWGKQIKGLKLVYAFAPEKLFVN